MAETTLLTNDEAADFLRISRLTLPVWRCTKRHRIPYVRVGSAVRYRRADLEKYLESRVTGGDAPAKARRRQRRAAA